MFRDIFPLSAQGLWTFVLFLRPRCQGFRVGFCTNTAAANFSDRPDEYDVLTAIDCRISKDFVLSAAFIAREELETVPNVGHFIQMCSYHTIIKITLNHQSAKRHRKKGEFLPYGGHGLQRGTFASLLTDR